MKRWVLFVTIAVLALVLVVPMPASGKRSKTPKNYWAMTTPEGVVIEMVPRRGWTAREVYLMLKENAYQLDVLGPNLTLRGTLDYGSSCMSSAGTSGGRWTTFRAVIYLDQRPTSAFQSGLPDHTIAHEYGHAWSLYHYYITHQHDWTPYLEERGLLGDPRLDTTYAWGITELIADDYRLLFGSETAQEQGNYINRDIPDPRDVPGLTDWFTGVWSGS